MQRSAVRRTGERPAFMGMSLREMRVDLERYRFARRTIEDHAGNNAKVLDLGCAPGHGTNLLGKSEKISSVVGLDYDEKAVKAGHEKYREPSGKYESRKPQRNIHFVVGDASKPLPFRSNSLHAITSLETIEHLKGEDHETFLSEITRVLKPNGVLVLSTPNRAIWGQHNPFHLKEYTLKELRQALEKHFEHVEIKRQGYGKNRLHALIRRAIETVAKADVLNLRSMIPKKGRNKIIESTTKEGEKIDEISPGKPPFMFVAVCKNPKK